MLLMNEIGEDDGLSGFGGVVDELKPF